MEKSRKSTKLKTENLKKKLKSAFLEKNEFEIRDGFRLSDYKTFWRSQFQKFLQDES